MPLIPSVHLMATMIATVAAKFVKPGFYLDRNDIVKSCDLSRFWPIGREINQNIYNIINEIGSDLQPKRFLPQILFPKAVFNPK